MSEYGVREALFFILQHHIIIIDSFSFWGFEGLPWVIASFNHHRYELGCEFRSLIVDGEGVDVSNCRVERGVAFNAGDGIAFESFLVEKHVDYLIYQES